MTSRQCHNCRFTDGLVYTSYPPKYKCTITGKFHTLNSKCDCEHIIYDMIYKFYMKEGKTMLDWEKAENYLNILIAEYTAIGWPGIFGLQMTLLPLKRRLDSGERTQELYDEIMECK